MQNKQADGRISAVFEGKFSFLLRRHGPFLLGASSSLLLFFMIFSRSAGGVAVILAVYLLLSILAVLGRLFIDGPPKRYRYSKKARFSKSINGLIDFTTDTSVCFFLTTTFLACVQVLAYSASILFY